MKMQEITTFDMSVMSLSKEIQKKRRSLLFSYFRQTLETIPEDSVFIPKSDTLTLSAENLTVSKLVDLQHEDFEEENKRDCCCFIQ